MTTECPLKAAAFDKAHKAAPRFGKNHAGAKQLAELYTKGQQSTVELDTSEFNIDIEKPVYNRISVRTSHVD